MNSKKNQYRNLVFTDHSLERMRQRHISNEAVFRVIQAPDSSKQVGKNKTKFVRSLNQRQHHVVAAYDDTKHAWIVVSVWVRGEDDKPSLEWQILSLPFTFLWWMVRQVFKKRSKRIK